MGYMRHGQGKALKALVSTMSYSVPVRDTG